MHLNKPIGLSLAYKILIIFIGFQFLLKVSQKITNLHDSDQIIIRLRINNRYIFIKSNVRTFWKKVKNILNITIHGQIDFIHRHNFLNFFLINFSLHKFINKWHFPQLNCRIQKWLGHKITSTKWKYSSNYNLSWQIKILQLFKNNKAQRQ
jgi:hypothetical protein